MMINTSISDLFTYMPVILNEHCATAVQSLTTPRNPEYPLQFHDLNPQVLRFACWNIKGFNSRIVGNKLMDPDFLSEIDESDIIGLSETHIYDGILNELDIPGFTLVEYKNRPKIRNVNKASGGLAVFAKDNIAKNLEIFKTTNNDIIWVKFDKKRHELSNDIYLGSVYMSGENNTKSISDKIKSLSEDIELIN